jgi:hypothetical protein
MMSATIPPRTRASVPAVRRPSTELAVRRVPSAPPPDLALLPNVLLPGVSHAGAAMLTADLGRHPDLCLPAGPMAGHFHPLRYGRPVEVHPHDYDRHFATWAGQCYRVETSPEYFDGGRLMAESLAATLPGLRVIMMLRDPAHRLWTGYADKLARRRLPAAITFDTFIDRCLALRANGADRFEGNRHFRTLSSGFYIDYLPGWLDVFGDRLQVVFTEDLQEDPAAGIRSLYGWLGVDPVRAAAAPDDDEPGDGYPAPEPAAGAGRRFWPVLPRRSGVWRQPPASIGPVRPPRQSERSRSRIRSLYAGANQELAALLVECGVAALPAWLAESEV